jgi:DNA primase
MDAVAEIKARLSIVDYLAGRLELRRAGRNYKACCPFHQEKTPSFIISPERQFAWCYGCQNGGDIFKLVQLLEGVDFREALEILADKAGVELPKAPSGVQKEKRQRLLEINAAAAEFFIRQLAESTKAKEYLQQRGLAAETVKFWQIGYAPEGYDALHKYLAEAGYDARDIAESGVAGLRELGGTQLYDRFRDRVTFPICDAQGRVVAFTARILGEGEPKYLNSPESPIFSKGSLLFGLDKARETIRKEGVVVVEGQLDVISCHQAGYTQVVASSGTALTETHLRMLRKLTDALTLAPDADRAGREAALRVLPLCLQLDFTVRIADLSAHGKDADDCIRKDPALFGECLAAALTPLDYLLRVVHAEADLTNSSVKKKVVREILQVLRHISSAVEQEEVLRDFARRIGVSETALRSELAALPAGMSSATQAADTAAAEVPTASRGPSRAEVLLGLALEHSALAREVLADYLPAESPTQSIWQALQTAEYDTAAALAELPEEEREIAERLQLWVSDKYSDFSESVLRKELAKLRAEVEKGSREETKHDLLVRLAAAEEAGDTAAAEALMQEYQKLLK